MPMIVKRVLFWMPRVLGVLFAMFLGLFALDIFGAGYNFWDTILGLLIHLVPVYMVIIVLAISWRWPWVGAVIFFGLALLYVVVSGGREHWSAYLAISGPLVLLSGLFLLNWIYRAELATR